MGRGKTCLLILILILILNVWVRYLGCLLLPYYYLPFSFILPSILLSTVLHGGGRLFRAYTKAWPKFGAWDLDLLARLVQTVYCCCCCYGVCRCRNSGHSVCLVGDRDHVSNYVIIPFFSSHRDYTLTSSTQRCLSAMVFGSSFRRGTRGQYIHIFSF